MRADPRKVFEFSDVAEYFRHLQAALGKGKRPLTLERLSSLVNYRSPRSLAMIMKGQRAPSVEMLQAISRAADLSTQEAAYLHLLGQKKRRELARKPSADLEERMKALRPRQFRARTIGSSAFACTAEWEHWVIRQLLELPDFKEDHRWICRKLRGKVTPKRANQALRNLLQAGVIERDPESGRLRIREGEAIATAFDIPSRAIRLHHSQMLERAREALNEQEVLEREFLAITLRFDKKRLFEAKSALRDFAADFVRRFGADTNDTAGSVFQLNLNLFRHTDE
ncbi:MAG: TIGR02147 family protein [Oligoflexia bacterium]|nr:TIGR02147 family protein [Oligoflexia bacterium]